MLFGKYSFHCKLLDDAILPQFKGSTFRGAFGSALKKVACALKHEQCNTCLVRERCVYSVVFETLAPVDGPAPSPPHPFVIEPPESLETFMAEGSDFNFSLLLFGRANGYLPYFVYALEQVGRTGIGGKIGGKRAEYRLERVSSRGCTLYEASSDRLYKGSPIELSLKKGEEQQGCIRELELVLQTPLRLKYENRLHGELPFHILIRTALRRLASLCNHWGNGEPEIDYAGMVRRAAGVRTEASRLEWVSFRRYSTRQRRSVSLGGLIGHVRYAGNLSEFEPLLRFCEKVHLGKATAFGLGQIRVAVPGNSTRDRVPGPSKDGIAENP